MTCIGENLDSVNPDKQLQTETAQERSERLRKMFGPHPRRPPPLLTVEAPRKPKRKGGRQKADPEQAAKQRSHFYLHVANFRATAGDRNEEKRRKAAARRRVLDEHAAEPFKSPATIALAMRYIDDANPNRNGYVDPPTAERIKWAGGTSSTAERSDRELRERGLVLIDSGSKLGSKGRTNRYFMLGLSNLASGNGTQASTNVIHDGGFEGSNITDDEGRDATLATNVTGDGLPTSQVTNSFPSHPLSSESESPIDSEQEDSLQSRASARGDYARLQEGQELDSWMTSLVQSWRLRCQLMQPTANVSREAPTDQSAEAVRQDQLSDTSPGSAKPRVRGGTPDMFANRGDRKSSPPDRMKALADAFAVEWNKLANEAPGTFAKIGRSTKALGKKVAAKIDELRQDGETDSAVIAFMVDALRHDHPLRSKGKTFSASDMLNGDWIGNAADAYDRNTATAAKPKAPKNKLATEADRQKIRDRAGTLKHAELAQALGIFADDPHLKLNNFGSFRDDAKALDAYLLTDVGRSSAQPICSALLGMSDWFTPDQMDAILAGEFTR